MRCSGCPKTTRIGKDSARSWIEYQLCRSCANKKGIKFPRKRTEPKINPRSLANLKYQKKRVERERL